LVSFACSSAFADYSCRKLEIIEKLTYEKPSKTGLLDGENFQRAIFDTYGITHSAGKHVSIFVTEEHGYGGGAYEISSVEHENIFISVKLEFVADLFSIGTAVPNHRLLFFITEKPCRVHKVDILIN
jgi:hypothetical protein